MGDETREPAFPTKLPYSDTQGGEARDFMFFGGMTLRDYFAAKAMQAQLTGGEAAPHTVYSAHSLATDAYVIADAMLAAREASE